MQEIVEEKQKSQPSNRVQNVGIELKDFIQACKHNWFWFVISVILFASLAFLYAKSQRQFYSSTATIVCVSDNNKSLLAVRRRCLPIWAWLPVVTFWPMKCLKSGRLTSWKMW